jgi:thiol-disulfide isomerase/thioredoxin
MRLKIITIFCACLLGCAGIFPKNNPTVIFDDGNHFGLLSKSLIIDHDSYTWFPKQYDAYHPDLNGFNSANLKQISIKIFMGTWCHDSKREVPRLYKILDELYYDYENFEIIGLTKDKKGYFQDYATFGITNTPTIIFYRNDMEIGRIIEEPKGSLEDQMARIIAN